MHRSPASQRRRAKVRRRDQIRRRRAVTLAVLVTLIVLAVWAAYAIPGQTPARVPQSAAMPTVDGSPAGAGDVVVAQVEGLDFVLPVAREVTTAVAYHPVDNADTVPFAPAGDRLGGGSLGQKLADIFAGYSDVEMNIRLAHDPSLLLVLTHLTRPTVAIGDVVARGETVLGAVRGFPTTLDQALSRYTSDTGDHVQMMVRRVTSELAGP